MNPDKDPRVVSEFPRFVSTTLADLIRQADTKAVGVLSILGILTGALLTRLNSLKSVAGYSPRWLFIFSLSLVMILLSLKSIVRVVYPRSAKGNGKSMIYFEDIIDHSLKDYSEKGMSFTNQNVIEQMYLNSYNLATVTSKKYKALRQAMFLTVVTLVWAVAVLLLS